jgi:hypothetical protein
LRKAKRKVKRRSSWVCVKLGGVVPLLLRWSPGRGHPRPGTYRRSWVVKIGDARQESIEKLRCELEFMKADMKVFEKQRTELVMEASDDYSKKQRIKQLGSQIKDRADEAKTFSIRLKNMLDRHRDDDKEIEDVFTRGTMTTDYHSRWEVNFTYRNQVFTYQCRYAQLFLTDKKVWRKKQKGVVSDTKISIPTWLSRHVWNTLVDPWDFLYPITSRDMYDSIYDGCAEHRKIYSSLYIHYGSPWVYGIGLMGDTVRLVTGKADRKDIHCMEIPGDVKLARRHEDKGRSARVYANAEPEQSMYIPVSGLYGHTKVRRKSDWQYVDRDYRPYEKIAWSWLHGCDETSIRPENQIPIGKLRDCYKKGNLWRPK